MAAKNTLKYKRNRMRPILDIVNDAIESCLRVLRSPEFKGSMSDLIRLLRLRLEFEPAGPLRPPVWVDGPAP